MSFRPQGEILKDAARFLPMVEMTDRLVKLVAAGGVDLLGLHCQQYFIG